MSLANCIPGMVKRGEIDPTRGARMKELFDELDGFYRRSMGPDAAAAEASEATLRQLASEARLKKRQTLLQVARQRDAVKDMGRFTGGDRYAAIRALLDDDDRAPYREGNVTTSQQRIEFQMHARVQDFIEQHRRTLLGKPKDQTGLEDVVRELHGQATGNARAKVFSEAIDDTFEQLRQRFNAAGGNIRKLKGFGMPHRHDALKVRAAGRDQWIQDITPLLDRSAMIDDRTGAPFTDRALDEVLGDVWETIRTNGLTGEATSAFTGGGKLANRRAEHRFLHFADGDAWLRYDKQYGSGENVFNAIMGHIAGMSKDIAIMERLGPNPDQQIRYLLDMVDREEAQGGKKIVGAVRGLAGGRKRTDDLWRYIKGESNVMVLPEGWWEKPGYHIIRTVQGTRNVLTSAMLGSAPLSAISDVNTGLLARGYFGLPETSVLSGYLKQLNPTSGTDRKLAIRLGMGMADAAHSMASIARYYGQTEGPGWTQVIADSTLRISGLNKFTEAGQRAFGLDLLGTLADHRGSDWADLPAGLRTAMERNGIEKYDWAAIRAAEPIMSGGAAFVDPQAIRDQRVADRVMNMVLRGRAMAVQESSVSARSMTTMGTSPGTLGGEVLRNSLQFKGFAISLMMKQARILSTLDPAQKAVYAARFMIGMTMFGAAAIQLREIAKGRDPRPMDNHEFWGDAVLQGGGVGIIGDLVGVFREDRVDIGTFLGGPISSLAVDSAKAAKKALPGKVREDGTQRAANPGGAVVGLAKRYTPGGNIWYLRAAWERTMIDQLMMEHLDPDADDWRTRQMRQAEHNGQGFWWAPGADAPDRAPELMNALGGESSP